jgi:hypothetical protein
VVGGGRHHQRTSHGDEQQREQVDAFLQHLQIGVEALVEDRDQLEAEQRLDAGQDHARLVQRELDRVLERHALGVLRLLLRRAPGITHGSS